jgi:hypothetical protein
MGRRCAEVWKSSGFGPALEALRRHPLFVPLMLAGLIVIAITTAGVTADEVLERAIRLVNITTFETSNAWWALPPALLVAGAAAFSRVGSARGSLFVLGALIVTGFAAVRYQAAIRGALPYLSVREVGDLFTFGLIGLALWGLSNRSPAITPPILGIALMLVALARWSLEEARSPFSPDVLPVIVSLPFVIPAILYGRRIASHPLQRTDEFPAPSLHMLGLVAGMFTGWFLQAAESSRPDAHPVGDALGALWSQSVGFGHGYGGLARLLRVYLEPVAFDTPDWMGWTGFLAVGGVAAAIALAGISVGLLFAEAWGRLRQRPAAMVAQLLIGLTMVGGPNSMLPLLLIFVWTGLALSAPLPERLIAEFEARRSELARWVGLGLRTVMLLLLFVGMLAIRGPFKAAEVLSKVRVEDLQNPELERRLDRAGRLNPLNPAVPMIRAAWLREQLTRSPRWDESLYLGICDAYAEAIRLDPYDPAIVLKLAEVQSIAERPDDSVRTARQGLQWNPGSQDLMSWLLYYASSNNMTELAGEMIQRSLYLSPEDARWWRDRYRFESRAGRATEAGAALGVALTAAITNPAEAQAETVRAAFDRADGSWQTVDAHGVNR